MWIQALAQPPAWERPQEATARRADFGLIRRGLAGHTERGGFRTDRSHRKPLGRQSPPEQFAHCCRPAGHAPLKAEIVYRIQLLRIEHDLKALAALPC